MLNLSAAQLKLNKNEQAKISAELALTESPNDPVILNQLGVILHKLKDFITALDIYMKCLNLEPEFYEAYINLGNTLKILNRLDEALAVYEKAIELNPDNAEAYRDRGNLLNELKRYDDALESYETALELKPDLNFLYGTYLHTKMKICDWNEFTKSTSELKQRLLVGKRVATPFVSLGLIDELNLQLSASTIWMEENYPIQN